MYQRRGQEWLHGCLERRGTGKWRQGALVCRKESLATALHSTEKTISYPSLDPLPPSPPFPPSSHSQIKTVIHGKWMIDKMEFEDVDELVIAQGNNLQERKRLLWETCDCVVVLPGGTGTWDELMEVGREVGSEGGKEGGRFK